MNRSTLAGLALLLAAAGCTYTSEITPPSADRGAEWQWTGDMGTAHSGQAYMALMDYCDGKGLPYGATLTAPVDCNLVRSPGRGYAPTDDVAGLRSDLRRLEESAHMRDIQAGIARNTYKVRGSHVYR